VALDSHGKVYTWGVPFANGHGKAQTQVQPKLLQTWPFRQQVDSENDDVTGTGEQDNRDRKESDEVIDIGCGACFTVVVLKSGKVCSWGAWAGGRCDGRSMSL
jgi:alpha-tubulin suppressor-like RCC1 family protein